MKHLECVPREWMQECCRLQKVVVSVGLRMVNDRNLNVAAAAVTSSRDTAAVTAAAVTPITIMYRLFS